MDFSIKMSCPMCGENNNFHGGTFRANSISTMNYKCKKCGCNAMLIIDMHNKFEVFEIRGIKPEE